MGISWSKRQHHHHSPPPSLSQRPPPLQPSSSSNHPPPLPPPPPGQPCFAYGASPLYPATSQNPNYSLISDPYAPHSNGHFNYGHNHTNRPIIVHSNYHGPYYPPQVHGWSGFRPPPPPPVPMPAVPYVDDQNAKKIKNDINVHKDTIKLEVDMLNKDCHLVSFTFDALVDGSISIFYFAKEEANCSYAPVYAEIKPVRIAFQKGLSQKFCQPSGTGIDLGFFDMDDLSKLLPGENAFPIVIVAESCLPSTSVEEHLDEQQADKRRHAQITEAIVERNNEDHFQVKVIKQILWVEGVRYELREIYGIGKPDEAAINDDSGKECVICMTEPKDTAVLPCRHMCLCGECAKVLRLQSNKCPICRQPIEELLEIKVNEASY